MLNVYIPRVFKNISKRRILAIFFQLNLGYIQDVIIVPHNDTFNSVYVYFSSWNDDENTQTVYSELESRREVKIMYDVPWYWKIRGCNYTLPYVDLSYQSSLVRNDEKQTELDKLDYIKFILESIDPMLAEALSDIDTVKQTRSKSA